MVYDVTFLTRQRQRHVTKPALEDTFVRKFNRMMIVQSIPLHGAVVSFGKEGSQPISAVARFERMPTRLVMARYSLRKKPDNVDPP